MRGFLSLTGKWAATVNQVGGKKYTIPGLRGAKVEMREWT